MNFKNTMLVALFVLAANSAFAHEGCSKHQQPDNPSTEVSGATPGNIEALKAFGNQVVVLVQDAASYAKDATFNKDILSKGTDDKIDWSKTSVSTAGRLVLVTASVFVIRALYNKFVAPAASNDEVEEDEVEGYDDEDDAS